VAAFTDPGGPEPTPAESSGAINTPYKVVSINWGDGTLLDPLTGTLSYNGSPGSKNVAFTVTANHTHTARVPSRRRFSSARNG